MGKFMIAMFDDDASESLLEALDDSDPTHSAFYAVYHEIVDLIVDFYHVVQSIGWGLIILFGFIAILFYAIVRDERKSTVYKDWVVRILIGAFLFAAIVAIIGWFFVIGARIGR
jgi:cytochrome bd-type quinol oxidase subunit 1